MGDLAVENAINKVILGSRVIKSGSMDVAKKLAEKANKKFGGVVWDHRPTKDKSGYIIDVNFLDDPDTASSALKYLKNELGKSKDLDIETDSLHDSVLIYVYPQD